MKKYSRYIGNLRWFIVDTGVFDSKPVDTMVLCSSYISIVDLFPPAGAVVINIINSKYSQEKKIFARIMSSSIKR